LLCGHAISLAATALAFGVVPIFGKAYFLFGFTAGVPIALIAVTRIAANVRAGVLDVFPIRRAAWRAIMFLIYLAAVTFVSATAKVPEDAGHFLRLQLYLVGGCLLIACALLFVLTPSTRTQSV
jgi:hypothetical protein